jgi:hypothetical protein
MDDHVGPGVGDRRVGDALVREIAVSTAEQMDLVGSIAVAKLVLKRAADEPGSACEQHLHGRRVYWRACALLAVVLLCGCDHGKRRTEPKPPQPKLSFVALDREHQRLVRDYEPVSSALIAYELAFRDWRLGRLSAMELQFRAGDYRKVVVRSLHRLRLDRATGETAHAKQMLVTALRSREGALAALPRMHAYDVRWNRSLEKARAGLTVLQDIRDRARLIPLPEDSVS